MQFFKRKNISDLTLADILREQRSRMERSLEEAAKHTKIDIKYLKALESGEYSALPEGIYGKNFLREYGAYLGLKYRDMLPLFEAENSLTVGENNQERMFSRQRVKGYYFISLPKLLRNIILLVAVLLGFAYLGFRVKKIIAPPELIIHFPPLSYATDQNKIEVSGQTEVNVRVFINGKEVLSDGHGAFKEDINLKEGMNDIDIIAKKRYGKDAEITRQVLAE